MYTQNEHIHEHSWEPLRAGSLSKNHSPKTANSANATNCVSLYDLRGIHRIKLILNPNLLRRIYDAQQWIA